MEILLMHIQMFAWQAHIRHADKRSDLSYLKKFRYQFVLDALLRVNKRQKYCFCKH